MQHPRADLELFAATLAELKTALTTERAALEKHDAAQLEQATASKNNALEILNSAAFGSTLPDRIAACEDHERRDCELRHNDCLTLARELRDFNLVNGKILNRSQNSIREIINILSGKRPGGLYGESGQPTADAQASGSIAKA